MFFPWKWIFTFRHDTFISSSNAYNACNCNLDFFVTENVIWINSRANTDNPSTFKSFHENSRNAKSYLWNQFEQFVVGQVFESKFPLACVPRIGLTQNSVTISGDDLPRFQKSPSIFFELFVSGFDAKIFDNSGQENQHFLVSKTMKRSGKAAHAGGEGKVGIGQGWSYQVSCVGRNVASLVIAEKRKLNAN